MHYTKEVLIKTFHMSMAYMHRSLMKLDLHAVQDYAVAHSILNLVVNGVQL